MCNREDGVNEIQPWGFKMFFGIVLSPSAWAMILIAVIGALVIPFMFIAEFANLFPAPLSTIIEVSLGYVGFPLLLCYLHSRKLFGRGMGSMFFFIYKWFYVLIGVVALIGTPYAEGGFNVEGFMFGVIFTTVGLVMIWWTRKIDKSFQDAVETGEEIQAEADREAQIQMQAEAILRAEQMKAENQNP